MSADRIVLVGIAWTLLLLLLLVLRELLHSSERRLAARVVPVLNLLTGVMVVAFSVAAVIRLGLLIDPPDVSAQDTATPTPAVVASVTITPPPLRTPPLTPSPTPSPMPSARPTPTPTPTRSPTPTPTPTLAPTPSSSPSPTPSAGIDVTFGTVTVPTRFVDYRVTGRRVTGFRKVTLDEPVTARGVGPRTYRLETLGDPGGKKLLVRILAGPLKGTLVSPDDPGVVFVPEE